jgi:hypothetical protein
LPTLAIVQSTSGVSARTCSTFFTTASVCSRPVPSGVSTRTRNCRVPAFGKSEKPIFGMSITLPATSADARSRVTTRFRSAKPRMGR